MSPRNPFKRSGDVPREAVSAARLGPGEKVLTGAQADDGAWLLGTRDAFHVVPKAEGPAPDLAEGRTPAPEQARRPARIAWECIERADWDRDEDRLVVSEVGEFGRVQPRHEFRVSEPGLLLDLVRERVTASVVLQRRVATEGKRGLFVIARRPPAGGGEVQWAYQFDPGVDPEDPVVRAAADAALRSAQDELGL